MKSQTINKTYIALVLFILLPIFKYAQTSLKSALPVATNLDYIWAKAEGADNIDVASVIDANSIGEVAFSIESNGVIGFDNGDSYPGQNYAKNIYIVKYDEDGNTIWTENITCTNGCHLADIAIDETGQIYILIDYRYKLFFQDVEISGTSLGMSLAIAKYTSDGILSWVKSDNSTLFAPNLIKGTSIDVDDSGVYFTGYFRDTLSIDGTTFVSSENTTFFGKISSTGTLNWLNTAIGTDYNNGMDIVVTPSYFFIGGSHGGTFNIGSNSVNPTSGFAHAFLGKFDLNGNNIWLKNYGGVSDVSGHGGIYPTDDGGVFMGGVFLNSANFGSISLTGQTLNSFVIKVDANGNVIWGNHIENAHAYELIANSNGEIVQYINSYEDINTPNGNTIAGPFTGLAKFSITDGQFLSAESIGMEITSYDQVSNQLSIFKGTGYAITGRFSGTTTIGNFNFTANGSTDHAVAVYSELICQPSSANIEADICMGTTYDFNGQMLTTSGTYTSNLLDEQGCDSIVILDLAVNPLPISDFSIVDTCLTVTLTNNSANVVESQIDWGDGLTENLSIGSTRSHTYAIDSIYTICQTGISTFCGISEKCDSVEISTLLWPCPIAPVNINDSLELVNFYNNHCGIDCTLNWDFDEPVNTWEGIAVLENRVIGIDLYSEGLSGVVPDLNLPKLQYLLLSENNFTGQLPDFSGLPELNLLYIYGNNITGYLPNFSNLPVLTELYLYRNNIDGTIPDFNNLNNLEEISLGNNNLEGTIPDFSNLPALIDLDLEKNKLTGSIPDFSNLPNLLTLDLSANRLMGTIPDFSNIPNLLILNLIANRLTGTIPDFTNLTDIRDLLVSENYLEGEIPNLLDNTNLEELLIAYNQFDFNDVMPVFSDYSQLDRFNFTPQYHGEIQSYIIEVGDTLSLELSYPLSGNNNQNVNYQWKHNNGNLGGEQDSMLLLENISLNNLGFYDLVMTDDSRVPGLLVISKRMYVTAIGYDLFGQPVNYAQVMMEFDNETDKIAFEAGQLYPNGGWVQDSCSCNRHLYLWQFPTDTAALEVLLNINTRTETQGNKADVDGGPNNIFNLGVSNNTGTAWAWQSDYAGFNYPDSVTVYLMDSGMDNGGWNPEPYLLNEAPLDSCYNISAAGYGYTDTLATINIDYIDSLGHGTYGYRTITEGLDSFMNIKVVPLKVFDQGGEGTLFKFVCAMYHAIDHGADIINISAGYRGEPSGILENAVQQAQQKGIFIVTATGNDSLDIDETPQYPAFFAGQTYEYYENGNSFPTIIPYDNVISVAAINAQDSLACFSNYGSTSTTLTAYGENISGYGVGGESVVSSGTSMSTFLVTRELAAEIAKEKSRSQQDIWSAFESLRLTDNPPTFGLTSTGKKLDINLTATCLPTLLPQGNITNGTYQAGFDIQSSGIISTGNMVNFKAGQVILLDTGFRVEQQASLSAEIEECVPEN